MMGFQRVTKLETFVQIITITPALFRTNYYTRSFQIRDNSLHRPLRDTYLECQISNRSLRITRQAYQDMRVVSKERPT